MNINKIETGIRIRDFRLSLGLSQTEFAEQMDTDQPVISAYEQGLRLPSTSFFTKITKLYGASQEWFTAGIGSPKIKPAPKADPHTRIGLLEKKIDFMEKKLKLLEFNLKKTLDMLGELAEKSK
ncbi:MAG: helix-turn-helix domain-containing protein [Daejeonella sp.]|uniref:helix-turn-helix domain-containing protein n=1 Tax=Daejeonella sp. TaxID=2805397 RepID=UPI002735AB90|nr:helix-turn-helix domain-containing protein [Daejeonella sp.]MDP3469812.1 helix-turn-helix domain-containing protein [Daejeonella sp.]